METNIDYEYFELLKRLKEARKAKGFTQKEMGELLGVQERSYHNLEAGKTTFDAKKLMLVLAKLEVNPFVKEKEHEDDSEAIEEVKAMLTKALDRLS